MNNNDKRINRNFRYFDIPSPPLLFNIYSLCFGQIGSSMPTRNKNLVTLSSIHVQVDSMGFYFQQTRFQMPASPYRRGKAMCLEQDTIGSGCTMGAPPRLKFVEGFARERGRVIRFHPRGCLYLLKIVLLSSSSRFLEFFLRARRHEG